MRSPSTLNSMPYFRDFCRFFQYQPPALWLQCIEVSQTSSDSEDVSLQKRHLLSVRTDHAVSCRHDKASKRENCGKHLQNLKMFYSTPRSGGRWQTSLEKQCCYVDTCRMAWFEDYHNLESLSTTKSMSSSPSTSIAHFTLARRPE